MEEKISEYEFVIRAIKRLKKPLQPQIRFKGTTHNRKEDLQG